MRRVWPSTAAVDIVIASPILGAQANPLLHHEEISRLHLASIVQSQFCRGSPRPAKRAQRARGTISPPLYSLYGVPLESSRLTLVGPPSVLKGRTASSGHGHSRARAAAAAVRSSSSGKRAVRPSLNHGGTVIQKVKIHTRSHCQKSERVSSGSNDRTDSLYQVFWIRSLRGQHTHQVRSGDMRPQFLLLLLHHTHTHTNDDDVLASSTSGCELSFAASTS